MDYLKSILPPENSHTFQLKPSLGKADQPSTVTTGSKKPGDILLEHIDSLRYEKLQAYVDGESDIDHLINEYVFQVNSAIDLFSAFVANQLFNNGENHTLSLARKRAENGLQWLDNLR